MAKSKLQSEFERQLNIIENSINDNPAVAYRRLHSLMKKSDGVQERSLIYCKLLTGRCRQRQGNMTKAYMIISDCTAKLEQLHALRETAMGYHYLSQINAFRADIPSAHDNCMRGLQYARSCRDRYAQLCLILDLSPVYAAFGNFDASLDCYLQCIELFNKYIKGKNTPVAENEDYIEFILLLNTALRYQTKNQFDKSLYYLNMIEKRSETLLGGMYIDQVNIEYINIAFKQGNREEALRRTQTVLERLREKKRISMHNVPVNCINLCLTLQANGEYELSYELATLAREIVDKDSDPRVESLLYRALGAYYEHIGQTGKALEAMNSYATAIERRDRLRQEEIRQSTLQRFELQKNLDKQRRLEEKYRAETAELAVAKQASAAKGDFMSRISHEIRTPLNAIIGYNTLASAEVSGAHTDAGYRQAMMKVADCLGKSSLASKHLLTLINDVLDMSAIESGKMKINRERFDFKSLLTSLTTIFYSQAKAKGVNIEVNLDTLTEEWFIGDQTRVNQILTNLLSNAIKFTPDGGSVKLTVSQPDAKTEAAHILFVVSDTGIGMSPDYLKHIWTPFEQADATISRRFGGTGLGLSITKNLIDLMGGTIEVESTLGEGTTFTINLTFEHAEQPDRNIACDFSGIKALVIDDDRGTCDYIKLLFDRFGARCQCETSGADGIKTYAAALKSGEPFTLCLVDWRMPVMDGLETVARIRKLSTEKIPITVISAYDYSEIADRAAEVGVTSFISKPLFQSSLFDLLANVCGVTRESKSAKDETFDFGGARILMAEDNEMNMEIAKSILEGAGLQVDCVWNGMEAVEAMIASPSGRYRAILMDVQMPVMDGHTATKLIRQSQHPEATTIPIIAMTADAFSENVSQALAAGMNDHVSKPIDLRVLFTTLGKYIQNRK